MNSRNTRSERLRRLALAIVLWAFGLATTTLLLGLWGRTVTSDVPTLEASARAALTSEAATDRLTEWIGNAVSAATESTDGEIGAAVQRVAASQEAEASIATLVTDLVEATLAEPGDRETVDLEAALDPVMPLIASELAVQGIDIEPRELDDAIATASDVILTNEEVTTVATAVRSTRSLLTNVLVAGIAAMILFGSLAIALAEEHLAMVRSLANRLAISAVTFAVVLRLGAWAIDPRRGRSPLPSGGSVLLGSNHVVLFLMAAAGIAVALASGVVIQNGRRGVRVEQADASEDDTLELTAV